MPSRFIGEIDKRFINTNSNRPERKVETQQHKPKIQKPESVVGKMIQHNEMGTGVVIGENGDVLTIAFKTRGIKNVQRDFVKFV